MSIWTHVAATIRIDALRLPGFPLKPLDLGTPVRPLDSDEVWRRCDIPRGSEGSLQFSVWEEPDMHHLAAYVVTIWGDLRDYSDAEEILAYLTRVTAGQMVRQGVANIEVEGSRSIVTRFNSDTNVWAPA